MKPAEYWRRRSEEVAARQFAKADAYQKELAREYARAMEEIRRSIEVFYQRYAINGEVSMAEARRQLSGDELRRFKMTLEEFTEKAKNNADGRWTKQLNEVYYRVRVSRYEALLTEIRQVVELLAGSRQRRTGELLGDIYEDTYYRTIYEIQRGTGFGITFAKIDRDALETVLGTQFAGSNWSKRIWGDRDKLIGELRTRLAQAFIRGESAERTARELADRMRVSLSNAERLVQTETAFFVGEATAAGYKASGVVHKYEFLATLDSRTSEVCRSMDGRVFALSEREVGVNYPPLHARCRSTVVPYFDDEIDPGERIARDEDGQTYYVPGDISYQQWYEKYVQNQNNDSGGSPRSKDTFKPAQSIKEAENFAIKELGFTSVKYDGLDLVSVNTLNSVMQKVFDRYPKIKGFASEIEAVDTDKFVAQAVLQYAGGQVSAGLKVSTKYFQSAQIDDIIKASVDAKHWPEGSNPKSIFIHEFGHLLEYAYGLKARGLWVGDISSFDDLQIAWSSIEQGILSKEIREQALKNLGITDTPENVKNELSNYANLNSKEFLAESFAEAEGTPKPRRLAVEVIRILREKLKEVGLL